LADLKSRQKAPFGSVRVLKIKKSFKAGLNLNQAVLKSAVLKLFFRGFLERMGD
jgi:hypothetical protein